MKQILLRTSERGSVLCRTICFIGFFFFFSVLAGNAKTYLTLKTSQGDIETLFVENKKLLASYQTNSGVFLFPEKTVSGAKEMVFQLSIQLQEAQSKNILFNPEDIKVVFYKNDKKIAAKVWNPVVYESTKLIKQRKSNTFWSILGAVATVANAYSEVSATSKGDYAKANYIKSQQDDLNNAMLQNKVNDAQRKDNIHISGDEFIYETVLSNMPSPLFSYQMNGKIVISPIVGTIDGDLTAMEITIPVGDDSHTYKFDIAKYKD